MKKTILYLVLFAVCPAVFSAEIRTWTDVKGKEYQAEFLRELFDKVTLRDAQGKEYRVAVEDLSEHDQRYLRVMVPPQIEIAFTRKVEQMTVPWDLWHEDNAVMTKVSGEIAIQKLSKRPFTSRLSAEVYLVAKEVDGDNFVLLGKTDSSFLFTDDAQNVHKFKAEPVSTRVYNEYNGVQRRGEAYAGYLVVVSDARGDIVGTKTDLGDWIKVPETIVNLRELSVRGAASVYSRHFDKTGKKTEVTRPKPYVPGNR